MSTVRSLSPWHPTLLYIRDYWKKLLPIVVVGLFLPSLIVNLSEAFLAQSSVETLRLSMQKLSESSQPVDISVFIAQTSTFIKETLGLWLVLLVILASSYLGLLHSLYNTLQKKPVSSHASIYLGLKTFLRKGILSLLFALLFCLALIFLMFGAPGGLGIFSFFAQILFLAAMGLCLLIPAFLVISPNLSAFRAVSTTITLKFAPPIKGLKWSIFFQVMSWQLLIILSLSLINALDDLLFSLDIYLNIPREWLFGSLAAPSYPSFVFIIKSILNSALTASLIAFISLLSGFYALNLQNIILSFHVGNYINTKA
jgi:hypothetical protein